MVKGSGRQASGCQAFELPHHLGSARQGAIGDMDVTYPRVYQWQQDACRPEPLTIYPSTMSWSSMPQPVVCLSNKC